VSSLLKSTKGGDKSAYKMMSQGEKEMKAITIRATYFRTNTIREIQDELEVFYSHELFLLCKTMECTLSEAKKAVAMHIVLNDSDFVFVIDDCDELSLSAPAEK
jgi:hypothetical protein